MINAFAVILAIMLAILIFLSLLMAIFYAFDILYEFINVSDIFDWLWRK